MVEKRNDQVVETAQEARQGELGPTVRIVLILSTIGSFVALGVVWYVFVGP